ncbi:hypothetical protein ES703_118395 [subsurface metagenome]
MVVTHIPLNLGPGHKGGYRINDQDIDAAASHKDLPNIKCLFAGIRLGYQQAIHIHPELPGVTHVKGMLSIHKGHHPALYLGLGSNMKG